LREALRFRLDQCLCEIRRNLLAFGQLTGLGENALFLTLAELQQFVDGQLSPQDAGRKAQDRRQAFLEPVEVNTFYIDGRPVEDFSIDEKVFRGTGTSPGRVSGRARIVTDPSHSDIQKGDIIVAENTDPGWTPILSTAVGLVAEEGGLLNHCSIVARELKIPAVVGIRGATRRIAEGDRLTIDGGLGLVRVETAEES
jgi:pyruvate,water dikinase